MARDTLLTPPHMPSPDELREKVRGTTLTAEQVAEVLRSPAERAAYLDYRRAAAKLLDAERAVQEARKEYLAAATALNGAIEATLPR